MNKYSYGVNAWLIKHNLNERSYIMNCSKLISTYQRSWAQTKLIKWLPAEMT